MNDNFDDEPEAQPFGEAPEEEPRWTLRPLLLALLGLATGVVAHLLLGEWRYDRLPTQMEFALLAGVVMGAALLGFTLERRLWWASLLFALAGGAIAGLVAWWNGTPGGWSSAEFWRMVSLLLAIAIAAPLFQAARDAGRLRFDYVAVHDHAWTNVVLWCACWVFVGLVFLLMMLLSELFHLIKLDFLRDLLREEWFWRALMGLAFGLGLGLLREHDVVVRLLQRVVATVLAVLAPVLAFGLIAFLLALPFTGLQPLWDAVTGTTPTLLACVIGGLVLANAVIGNTREQESRFAPLRFGAMGLALVILPLAVLAAVATGLRVGQHGFTPERLWAVTFVSLACLYGLGYWLVLVRGRLEWAGAVRPVNLALAGMTCLVALFLATPILSFNAISTADQVARLEAGRVAPDRFDWAALQYDFGEPGKAAVAKLRRSANAAIRAGAESVAKTGHRWDAEREQRQVEARTRIAASLRILPAGAQLPEGLRNKLADHWQCNRDQRCTVSMIDANTAALLVGECFAAPKPTPTPTTQAKTVAVPVPIVEPLPTCLSGGVEIWRLENGEWSEGRTGSNQAVKDPAAAAGFREGKVEVRPVTRRQVFVGGVPVGEAFE